MDQVPARPPIRTEPAGALPAIVPPAASPQASASPATDSLPDVPPAEAIERMDHLARELGHDLNNCLGIVGGRAELVLMYLDQGKVDGARKGIEVVLGQVERMKNLSREIRELRHRI